MYLWGKGTCGESVLVQVLALHMGYVGVHNMCGVCATCGGMCYVWGNAGVILLKVKFKMKNKLRGKLL